MFGDPNGGTDGSEAVLGGEPLQKNWSIDPTNYAGRFDRIVNIAEVDPELPNGEKSINETLDSVVEDGTLVFFPQGQYKMTRPFRRTGGTDIGLIGDNAVIRHGRVDAIHKHTVTQGEYAGSSMMFRIGTGDDPHHGSLVFGGFVFDWSWSENAGLQGLNAQVDGQAEIRNIYFHGVHSLGSHGNLRAAPHARDSVVYVDNVDMRYGGLHYRHTINTRTESRNGVFAPSGPPPSWSTTGYTAHPQMEGTIVLNRVVCGAWPDNGLYPHSGGGRQIVRNCYAFNSNVANIRVNGRSAWDPIPWIDGEDPAESPYPRTTVENCKVVVNDTRYPEFMSSQRGIWLRDGISQVRDCEIVIGIDGGFRANGGYALGASSGVDNALIENVQIDLRGETYGLYVGTSGIIQVEDVDIVTRGWSVDALRAIRGSPSLEDVTLNGDQIGALPGNDARDVRPPDTLQNPSYGFG